MNKYDFRLTPAYCLYNGVGIKSQSGKEIVFLAENLKNENLRNSLTKAFLNHLEYVRKQKDCPDVYIGEELIYFEKADRSDLRNYVSSLYEQSYNLPVLAEKKSIAEEREAAAVLLLESIIKKAREYNATDIHIEKALIRFRVQGKLVNEIKLENEKSVELIRRIKLLAGMNILDNRKSQDGQFYLEYESPLFIRVSTMSVISNGFNSDDESVVLRLLDTSRVPLSLFNLGFDLQQIDLLKKIIEIKNGLILICGPTGSGKSTTAASMLMELCNSSCNSKKIVSLEDPPEFIIPGITQIKLDSDKKNSYSDALKHVFRQDPDVLMIGEIRDLESCETAIRASLTGHLVIATMHTDNVLDSFYRIENFGVDSKLLVSVIRAIILQEMNYFDENIHLLADIAIPDKNINQLYSTDLSTEKFEELFTHHSNAGLVLSETVKRKNINDSFQPVILNNEFNLSGKKEA